MPTRSVPGTDLTYALISFDADGRERTDDPDGQMSQWAAETIGSEPVTDVFLISHGWRGDVAGAIDQYDRWIKAMANTPADLEQMRQTRPGFRPMLIGLHWPSEPWGDEELSSRASGGASFAPGGGVSKEQLIDRYAARLADTDAARAALQTLFDVAERNIAPSALPPEAVEAYQTLNREAGLGADGPGGGPEADREPFDPQEMYRNVRRARASFGGFTLGGLLLPLRLLSFWKMKDRARVFGESGGRQLVADLQGAVPEGRRTRFHLMGHSFGCVVVSAIVGATGGPALKPVDSLVLAQGALSLWSYCTEIPPAPGQRGYFQVIVSEGRVTGPIVTTQSSLDYAVGRFYPYGAGIRQQVTFAPGELPKYGSVGTFGVRGPGLTIEDREMVDLDQSYGFEGGTIYNLDASRWIKSLDGPSGAHNDIAHPQVAHAIWEAARVS